MDEEFAIQPLCTKCHRGNNGDIDKKAKIKAELLAITQGMEILQTKYPKVDWYQRKKYLEHACVLLQII